ncbi:MAG: T9SS type A sorting domain-containing protein, partial [Chitinivibrionales bacterium]|nr:T9SS type A sorting domain-containing protein [Chitinivibrionales bacterium]
DWSAGHDWGEPQWPVYEAQPSHTQTDCPQPEKWRVSIVNNMLVLGPWIRGDRSVRIFDGHGRLMLRKTLLDTNENTISLEGYGNGVFFIRISNQFAERTIKLIKS